MSSAKRVIATRPRKYTGAEMNSSAMPIASRSIHEPVLTADSTPIGMPIDSHRITAPPVRNIVTGTRSRISGSTWVLVW
jgi:hypothetical protein